MNTASRGIAIGALVVLVIAVVTVVVINRGDGESAGADTDATASPTADGTAEATPSGATGYTPTFRDSRCLFTQPDGQAARCGWLEVPEDRSDPDGTQIELHVAIFESTDSGAPDDPIVFLDGGPGVSTLGALQFQFPVVWAPLLENRDLILFDQRGIGLSRPALDCHEVIDAGRDALRDTPPVDELRRSQIEALTDCRARLVDDGIDLDQYNTAENAADVADLRIALEVEEWNILGISYGTRLAQTVMRDHPEGVRSVILDSTYPLGVSLAEEGPIDLARSLDELWEGCATDSACAAHFTDLEGRFYELADQLREAPQPVVFPDLSTGQSSETRIDDSTLIGLTFQSLYSPELISVLPLFIEQLEQGTTSTAATLFTTATLNSDLVSVGMQFSVQCSGDVPRASASAVADAAADYPGLAAFFASPSIISDYVFDACAAWQVEPLPASDEPLVSDIPTLVMAGEYDPITPPRFGDQVAASLANASFHEFPGLGHGTSILAECPRAIAVAFFDEPSKGLDTSCIDRMAGIDFVVPGEATAPLKLILATESYGPYTMETIIPRDWVSPVLGTHARADSAADQAAIVQQLAPLAPDTWRELLETQLGIEFVRADVPVRSTELGDWALWTAAGSGFAIDLAHIELDGVTGMVLLTADPSEQSQLVEQLLLPAIDAVRVSE